MGYRSKVILGVQEGRLSNEFDDILRKDNRNPTKSTEMLKIDNKDGYKTYLFEYIKWYHSDDWCKEIMDWLDDRQFHDLDSCWCVGMGEEGELHSEIGDWWEYVDVIRDINLIN